MRSIVSRRPTVSTVISCTALFVALGGTSYAAVTIDGSSIKNKSIAGAKVKANGLSGKQIKESSLSTVPKAKVALLADTAKLADRAALADKAATADKATVADKATTADKAITADKATTAENATNAQNAANAEQLGGKPATAFASGSVRVVRAWAAPVIGSASGVSSDVSASCDTGERAIGGGGSWHLTGGTQLVTDLHVTLGSSFPVTDAAGKVTGWDVHGRNFVSGPRQLQAHVLCTPVQP